MGSRALNGWKTDAQTALDEIEAAHKAVGGSGRGRRYATLQVNHAYVTLLSSQFQGFCRDLHTEAVAVVVGSLAPPVMRPIVQNLFVQGRKLDQGNPNPGNLGSDFARLGLAFKPALLAQSARNADRMAALEELNEWRNAVAHQDWNKVGGSKIIWLKTIQGWRRNCRALASQFDAVVGDHLLGLLGTKPW